MTLAGIEEASAVFIDANVFVYHFVGASPECTALLRRCETNEVQGSTSALVDRRLAIVDEIDILVPADLISS